MIIKKYKGVVKMLDFTKKMIYTGKINKIGKNGQKYTLINYLGDDGVTFSTIADCEVPENIKQLDLVEVKFNIKTGRYIQLRTVDIKKVG